jgi:LCP family protein required for cell wall assembly
MSDPWSGGPSRQATRRRPAGPPRPRSEHDRDDEPRGRRADAPAEGGRAAARRAARGKGHRQGQGRTVEPERPRGHAKGAGHGGGRGGRGGGRQRRRGRAKPPRRRRVLRGIVITLSAMILLVAAGGTWLYQHLNGNIHSVAIDGGSQEKPDAFGRTPINLLVIGSDGRNDAADCKLGGGCGSSDSTVGRNADVEMVVHISADRSNATVMSIPRDTETQIPACKDPSSNMSTPGFEGQINSALQYGPACQVQAVHQLTGITIDHFLEIDFSGVVEMSDAVGGVSVCVSNNVYDTYSHLKLSKGTHTLKGDSALEFVRTRHGLGDGSDLSRTYAQHIFLSAMIRKFKSAGTLADPTKVYGLANTATKALTVDTGLNTVGKLVALATDLNKVPTKRITFTTMQTGQDPNNANRVVVGAGAQTLFSEIANDKSLSSGPAPKKSAKPTSKPTSKSTPTATVPPSEVAMDVENGTLTSGRASEVATSLQNEGFSQTTYGNALVHQSTTTLTYGPGEQAQAQTAAQALGLSSSHLKSSPAGGVILVIGSDWPSGTTFPGGTASLPSGSSSAGDSGGASKGSHAQTAADSKGCADVSTFKTVEINGVPMTPTQAYAEASNKPDSAP